MEKYFVIFLYIFLCFIFAVPLGLADENSSSLTLSEPSWGDYIDLKHAASPAPIINLYWEGRSLENRNLETLTRLRERLAKISFRHFLSPAYFTKPDASQEKVANLLKSYIMPGDQVCLYLHPWNSLVRKAAINPKNSNTFWGNRFSSKECEYDCGQEVPLLNYSTPEIGKMIAVGKEILRQTLAIDSQCFLAGAWLSGAKVWPALAEQNIKIDYSPIDPELVKDKLGAYPLWKILSNLWSSPGYVQHPGVLHLQLSQVFIIPMKVATIDYYEPPVLISLWNKHQNSKTPFKGEFPLGIYQETLYVQKDRIEKILAAIIPNFSP